LTSPDAPAAATKKGVLLSVKVHPRAARPGIAGIRGGALLARLNSPPEKGKANEELIALLADAFEMKKAGIEIASGAASRNKKVLLKDKPLAEVEKILAAIAGEEKL
jgi:uncharacterized protein